MIYRIRLAVLFIPVFLMLMLLNGCTPGNSQLRRNDRYSNYETENDEFRKVDKEDFEEKGNVENRGVRSGRGYNNQSTGRDEYGNHRDSGRSDDNHRFNYENGEGLRVRNSGNRYEQDNNESSYSRRKYYQTGKASWYGREFHGRITASGVRFDMNKLTAAHKTLPFGTLIEIKNFDNGRTAIAEVNDRGPYRGNRIVDVSYGAAKRLGMISTGVAMVGIRVIRKGEKLSDRGRNDYYDENYGKGRKNVEPVVGKRGYEDENYDQSYSSFYVQAGAFYSRRNAENLKKKIEFLTRKPVVIVNDGDLYKVRIKGLNSRPEARKHKRILSDENIESFITKE